MEFRNKYWFLNNMYPCQVTIAMDDGNYTFECAEAAFHACKNQDEVDQFLGVDGFEARRRGENVMATTDSRAAWDSLKDDIMEYVVRAKFEQHSDLMRQLLNVKGDIVDEDTWKDDYWGAYKKLDYVEEQSRQPVYKMIGENKLGKILTKIRDENITNEVKK